MKLEDIETLWSADCKIDRTNLDGESIRVPDLHHKYYKIYIREKFALTSEERSFKEFYKLKHEYYTGKLSEEDLKQYGWPPFQFVLKGDLQLYIDSDKEISDKLIKIEIQREKVKFLESIIDSLNRRSFLIKNAIDFIKFSNGGA